MNVSRVKITLKLTLSLRFFFYAAGTCLKEFISDTFCITIRKMFYDMAVLCVTGKVFLTTTKINIKLF